MNLKQLEKWKMTKWKREVKVRCKIIKKSKIKPLYKVRIIENNLLESYNQLIDKQLTRRGILGALIAENDKISEVTQEKAESKKQFFETFNPNMKESFQSIP